MSNIMKIVGMDPSMSNFGLIRASLNIDTMKFAVESMEVVRTEPEKDKKVRKQVRKNSEDLDRARLLYCGAMGAIDGASMAFVEVPVGSQSARAMASYGVCLGVIAAVAETLPIIQVTPNDVKLAGCGIRTATKGEMIDAMVEKYPDAPWPRYQQNGKGFKKGDIHAGEAEHLADALAAIEAGLTSDEFRQTMAVLKSSPLFKSLMKTAA
jgi:Holliday junction resolvasome RuvABC endonuclease subunit